MDGINRLAKMLEGQKDKYLNIIVNYLMLQTELDGAFLNEEKNLKDMADFIKDKARKQATGGVAVIEDEVVFKWAKEYFIKSNDELKIKKTQTKIVNKKEDVVEKQDDEFGSIFGSSTQSETPSNNANAKEPDQISLFGTF